MELETEQLSTLRKIAKQHGFELRTSRRHGQGNIKAMLEAIAEGELVVGRVFSAAPNGHD